MFEIYNDILDKETQLEFYKFFTTSSGWSYDGFSIEPTQRFWQYRLDDNPLFTETLFEHIEQITNKKFTLIRVYANGQTHGQCGSVHTDSNSPSEYTFLYYLNPTWLPEWGGGTVFLMPGQDIQTCPFISNRGILFKANIPHVGLDPSSHFRGLRITIAYKLKLKENV